MGQTLSLPGESGKVGWSNSDGHQLSMPLCIVSRLPGSTFITLSHLRLCLIIMHTVAGRMEVPSVHE